MRTTREIICNKKPDLRVEHMQDSVVHKFFKQVQTAQIAVDDVKVLLLPLPFSFTVSQDLVDPERFLAVLLFF